MKTRFSGHVEINSALPHVARRGVLPRPVGGLFENDRVSLSPLFLPRQFACEDSLLQNCNAS
jgi:hypothetical protein